nr:MAG TPA: hypothetical protein [Caudoviricetes sp.]
MQPICAACQSLCRILSNLLQIMSYCDTIKKNITIRGVSSDKSENLLL